MNKSKGFSPVTRSRIVIAGVLAAVIVLGVISRVAPLGWPPYDKSLGDVLYGMAAYLGLVLLLPRLPIGYSAALSAAACLAVEFLQLTEINSELLKVPVCAGFSGRSFPGMTLPVTWGNRYHCGRGCVRPPTILRNISQFGNISRN